MLFTHFSNSPVSWLWDFSLDVRIEDLGSIEIRLRKHLYRLILTYILVLHMRCTINIVQFLTLVSLLSCLDLACLFYFLLLYLLYSFCIWLKKQCFIIHIKIRPCTIKGYLKWFLELCKLPQFSIWPLGIGCAAIDNYFLMIT